MVKETGRCFEKKDGSRLYSRPSRYRATTTAGISDCTLSPKVDMRQNSRPPREYPSCITLSWALRAVVNRAYNTEPRDLLPIRFKLCNLLIDLHYIQPEAAIELAIIFTSHATRLALTSIPSYVRVELIPPAITTTRSSGAVDSSLSFSRRA